MKCLERVVVSLCLVASAGCAGASDPSPAHAPAREAPPAGSSEEPGEAGEDDLAAHDHGGRAHAHRFTEPSRFVPAWNAPDRDEWQRPAEIVGALGLVGGETVVDLGAGTGYLVPKLSAAVGAAGVVIAADVERAMLEFIEDAAEEEGWANVRTHHHGARDPGLEPESVDAVVALNVWHHVEGREAFGAKLLEALRPGGVFVVVDFLDEETEGFGPPQWMRLSADAVRAELEAAGFEAEIVQETMPRHYVVRGRRPLEVHEAATETGGRRFTTEARGCVLTLGVEGSRLWLASEEIEAGASCAPPEPRLRSGFSALARAAGPALRSGAALGVTIGLHADLPSVERWFRDQARDREIQALLRDARGGRRAQRLAAHLLDSGALARYEALFSAMGLRIEGASLEKIEVRPSRAFARDLPESADWGLPPNARCALPFLTWLRLGAR